MDIIFHCDELNERGTAIACYDYAYFNQKLLGNKSIIFYDKKLRNNVGILEKFQNQFTVIGYEDFEEIDKNISNKYDLMYVIKGGNLDHLCSSHIPTMVHAVFPQSIFQIHGSSYAFISEWISKKSLYIIPTVPHIVNIPLVSNRFNLRRELCIPEKATVFGSYGGKNSFDIEFVKDVVIPFVLRNKNDVYFLFMNYEKFIDHPRAIFLPISIKKEYKEKFVATTDAMLHARYLGESFGLACAEFSSKNKPIISYKLSKDKHHHYILSSNILLYKNSSELIEILMNFNSKDHLDKDYKAYLQNYSPEIVMNLFEKHLIIPAIKNKNIKIQINRKTLNARITINKFFNLLSKLVLPFNKIKSLYLKQIGKF